ncbi:t-SNARE [Boletus reticuloceps]|uniref:t-SNARE n=1 Tax=Boletus reticuloceps TaxID=495285 RepID=A0A8I2YSA6_9AGAM|nr:t-SNARE [Boletus reticuloceps]
MSTAASSSSPTTRSRTLLFISYRDSRTRSSRFSRPLSSYDDPYQAGDEHEHLITPATVFLLSHVIPRHSRVDLSDQVEEILSNAQSKISALEKLHAKHVLPGFADRTAEEKEIEAATTDITRDLRRCHSLIQRIGSDQDHTFPPSNKFNTRRWQPKMCREDLQPGYKMLAQPSARSSACTWSVRLQGHAIKNQDLLIASGTITSKGSEGLTAADEDVQAAQAQIQETDVHDIRLRDHELTDIANSIASLAELFKDLSILVIDQGTLLDSIEYNIEQTSVHVAEAVKELDVATRYQKNTGRRKIIFLLLLIIFGLIVVLIFKPRRHPSSIAIPSNPMSSPDNIVPVHLYPRIP